MHFTDVLADLLVLHLPADVHVEMLRVEVVVVFSAPEQLVFIAFDFLHLGLHQSLKPLMELR